MVERQDIDALLIGSLYGELSSTEEARLAAHLESHPADRTALADLSRARDVVRESRILQVQFDPPQSISALLMQEAARRAPKSRGSEEQSWFQRFMRSFIAHPAMAAAAMLVLIIGVAGTVYMRQGDHYAKPTADDVSTQELAQSRAPAVATPATDELAKNQAEHAGADKAAEGDRAEVAQGSASTTADNFKVTIDDEKVAKKDVVLDGETKDRSRNNAPAVAEKRKSGKGAELGFNEQQKLAKEELADQPEAKPTEPKVVANAKATAPAKTAPKPPSRRLDVSTPSQGPKDFDSAPVVGRAEDSSKTATGSTTVAGAGGAGSTSTAPRSPAADPARPGMAPPPPPSAPTEKPADKPVDPLIAWAKERHAKVVAAVRAGNCPNAATIAVEISNRAPAYYASNVETDRTLKQCMQYITAQREKEAERSQRAKATRSRAADEAPSPAPAQSTK